jgi:hypothetical protein
MAPVMELEAESRKRMAIDRRSRVLIAAAAAAVLGSRFRILEINPAGSPRRTLGTARPPSLAGHARLLAAKASKLALRRLARRTNVRLRITLEDGDLRCGG